MRHGLLTILMLVTLFVACTPHTRYAQQLVEADSLMDAHPDSALQLLQSVSLHGLATEADKAYYALLLTQARDKNYIVQTDDSLIQMAVQYYDSHPNPFMQARSYYLWGSLFRDANDYPKAIDKYVVALSYIENLAEGAFLKASLLSNMGYLYYTQNLTDEADTVYRQAELLARAQCDTMSLCYSMLQQGMINLERGASSYPKAERQMLQALSLAETLSDTTLLLPVYHSLSMLYTQMFQSEKALKFALLNYTLLKDTVHCYRTFLLLGNAYFMHGQYETAETFFHKILGANRYFDTKADACMRLSEIEQLKGNAESSIVLERQRSLYQDSARISQQGHGILNTVIAHEKNRYHTLRKQYTDIIYVVVVCCVLVSMIVFIYIRKKHLLHQKDKAQWLSALQAEIARSHRQMEQLAAKERENESLRKQIHQLDSKDDSDEGQEYKTSVLYLKVARIAKTLSTVETEENLSEEEWSQFIRLTDRGNNGVISYLSAKRLLSLEEIQLCCLYLAQVPVKYMGHFLHGQARSTVQLKSKHVLQKMDAPQGMLLKDALSLLVAKLKEG